MGIAVRGPLGIDSEEHVVLEGANADAPTMGYIA